jgi:hypothetical protein
MKAIGDKVLSWFIVQDEDEEADKRKPAAPVESTVRAVEPEVPRTTRSAGLSLPAPASFTEVYRRAGIPDAELERLTRTLDLVATLPAEASPTVKRTIVEAALSAFGVPIDQIASTGVAALTALDRNVSDGEARIEAARTSTDEQIRKLTSEIERLRSALDAHASTQRILMQSTAIERSRIASVLDLFGRARAK